MTPRLCQSHRAREIFSRLVRVRIRIRSFGSEIVSKSLSSRNFHQAIKNKSSRLSINFHRPVEIRRLRSRIVSKSSIWRNSPIILELKRVILTELEKFLSNDDWEKFLELNDFDIISELKLLILTRLVKISPDE